MITVKAKLLELTCDIGGYITYVFQILDQDIIEKMSTRYIMCVRYPNWDHFDLEKGDIGFLNYKPVQAGVDQWFDGSKMNYYRYTDIIFMKFVKEKPETKNEIIL